MKHSLMAVVILVAGVVGVARGAEGGYTRVQDVIYGRLPGVALTMDVFTPKEGAKEIGVLYMVSGGWSSSHEVIDSPYLQPVIGTFIKRGYTVFAVVHGSQPKYTIPEILPQISRAVRYVRHHAKEFKVDPDHLGISGGSAGGHLSLMQGCKPVPADEKAKDPVDRESAAVQAVGCFFPPTDFLNYGVKDHVALGRGELSWLKGPFDFRELDPKTSSYKIIADEGKVREIGREISPIYFVTPDDAPALMIHGDADKLVPLQQAESMEEALKKAGVPVKVVVKAGKGHGWGGVEPDVEVIADWFDRYLGKEGAGTRPAAGK